VLKESEKQMRHQHLHNQQFSTNLPHKHKYHRLSIHNGSLPVSITSSIFPPKSDQNTFLLCYKVGRVTTRGALIFWRRPSKNYPRCITLQSEANLADGINFRLHLEAIEFTQAENPWSKSGIRLGAPSPPQSPKSVQKSDQK
jgi:hypothetical protein